MRGTGDAPNVPLGPFAISFSTSCFVLGQLLPSPCSCDNGGLGIPIGDTALAPDDIDVPSLPSPVLKSPLNGIKLENCSPNRSSRLGSLEADDGPGMFTSPSHPGNEANAFMDCIGSRYDVNIGLEAIVVKGPGEPKYDIVSKSCAEGEGLALDEGPEADATSALGTLYPSKRELGESCVEAVATEERALPGTRLGPAVEGLLLAKRLSDSDDESRFGSTAAVAVDVEGTENVKVACFNATFSFCRRLSISRR